ncbi:hypothetical protein OUZ56_023504 [Daphnia magna]|uniref:Uncharacterized protein n=1 Tax=Daphnia magna TaxID=35525 RepID=A0ABR0AZU8_9CRUS|nr:hypothetical protein OUZ56_023504 [Daphnia magna]
MPARYHDNYNNSNNFWQLQQYELVPAATESGAVGCACNKMFQRNCRWSNKCFGTGLHRWCVAQRIHRRRQPRLISCSLSEHVLQQKQQLQQPILGSDAVQF